MLPSRLIPEPFIDLTLGDERAHATDACANDALAHRYTTFLDHLSDPDLWPPLEHRGSLTKFLSAALQRWPAWPRSLGLDVAGQNAFNEESSQPLHVSSASRQQKLLVTYQCIKDDDSCSFYLCRSGFIDEQMFGADDGSDWQVFPGVPNGFFDAIAAGLASAVAPAPFPRLPAPGQTPGQLLRQSFSDWLRQHRPQDLPTLPADLVWQRWTPARSASPVAPSTPTRTPTPTLTETVGAMSPTGVPSPPAPEQPQAAGPSCPLAPELLPAPAHGPGHTPATEVEAAALIDCLRNGQWHAEMLSVLPSALVRLSLDPATGDRAINVLELELELDEGRLRRTYGGGYNMGGSRTARCIQVKPSASGPWFTLGGRLGPRDDEPPCAGVDGLLLAFVRLLSRKSRKQWLGVGTAVHQQRPEAVQRLRHTLSDLLAQRMRFVRLCMSIERLWPRTPEPDVLLRQCMVGNVLTWEGQQVLDRALVHQPLETASQRQQLLRHHLLPAQRRSELFQLGYDLLRANQLLSALGPTTLVGIGRRHSSTWVRQALLAEGGWQLHVHGSWKKVVALLGLHHRHLRSTEQDSTVSRCEAVAQRYAQSDTLTVPRDTNTQEVPEGPGADRSISVVLANRMGRDIEPLSAPRPGVQPASLEEAQALVQAIRTGDLNAGTVQVICHALTRCRFRTLDHPQLLSGVKLIFDDDTYTRFGFGFSPGSRHPQHCIRMYGKAGTARFQAWSRERAAAAVGPFDGMDGLLTACFMLANSPPLSTATRDAPALTTQFQSIATTLRLALAQSLTSRTDFVRLCMTFHRLWPDYPDPDIQLRQCMDGDQLTWEGRQLLNPSLITRTLNCRSDVRELGALEWEPGMRRELVFHFGFPMLQANALLGPYAPSSEGRKYIRDTKALDLPALDSEGGWLLYTLGSWTRVLQFLHLQGKAAVNWFGSERMAQWEAQAMGFANAGSAWLA